MLSTPFLLQAGGLLTRFYPSSEDLSGGALAQVKDTLVPEDHVVVIGHGRAGRRLAQVLSELGIRFVVIDLNPSVFRDTKEHSLPAVYGDATRPLTLHRAGVETAKLCVVLVNDMAAARRIVLLARHLNPTIQTIVRARYISEVRSLGDLGADIVVPEEMETTVRIFSHVLGAYMIPPGEIERHASRLRGEDYGVARGSIQEAHLMVLQGLDEEGLHTRAVGVREKAPAAGRTLQDLNLRRDHGLTVLAVRREGKTIANPSGSFRLMPGDRLVMVGMASDFASCADLFRTPAAELPTPGTP
jgi:CPA2 family monovalent cation:H+ antiporter-2